MKATTTTKTTTRLSPHNASSISASHVPYNNDRNNKGLASPSSSSSSSSSEGWIYLTPPLPTPIQQPGIASINDTCIIITAGQFSVSQEAHLFRPNSKVNSNSNTNNEDWEWTTIPPLDDNVYPSVLAAMDGYLYFIDGNINNNDATDTPPLPSSESSSELSLSSSEGSSERGEFMRLSLQTLKWERLRKMNHHPSRYHVAAIAFDGYVYIFGGSTDDTVNTGSTGSSSSSSSSSVLLDSSVRYDTRTGMWEDLPPLPSPRQAAAAVRISDGIYILGGAGNEDDGNGKHRNAPNVKTMFLFNITSQTWEGEHDEGDIMKWKGEKSLGKSKMRHQPHDSRGSHRRKHHPPQQPHTLLSPPPPLPTMPLFVYGQTAVSVGERYIIATWEDRCFVFDSFTRQWSRGLHNPSFHVFHAIALLGGGGGNARVDNGAAEDDDGMRVVLIGGKKQHPGSVKAPLLDDSTVQVIRVNALIGGEKITVLPTVSAVDAPSSSGEESGFVGMLDGVDERHAFLHVMFMILGIIFLVGYLGLRRWRRWYKISLGNKGSRGGGSRSSGQSGRRKRHRRKEDSVRRNVGMG